MDTAGKNTVGMVSVTFRGMSPREIVGHVSAAGLGGIEWGGDVHVPAGNGKRAGEVRRLTNEAGLEVVSYGSYHNLGKVPGKDQAEWAEVVETASVLGAPTIRVWAGTKGSGTTSESDFSTMVERAQVEADYASRHGMTVACEFHENTLTDSGANAARFLAAVNHRSFRSLWQPVIGASAEQNIENLRLVGKWLSHVHVFHWTQVNSGFEQRPLQEGFEDWLVYATEAERQSSKVYHLIEFVRGGDLKQFSHDADVLKTIIEQRSGVSEPVKTLLL